MNYHRLKIYLILVASFIPSILYSGGSSYSRYGYGDILRYGDSRTYAMAGTGIALLDDGVINILNPAALSHIRFTRFSTGFEYDRFTSKDYNGSSFYSTGGLQGLIFAFPISPENGIVLSVESTPYSKVYYAIRATNFDIFSDSKKYETLYGSGGLSYLGIGLSGSPLSTLHLGGRLNYMYGRTRQYQTSNFDNSNYSTTNFDRTINFSGFTGTFGVVYEGISELAQISSLRNLTLGFTLTTASSLDADAFRIYSGGEDTTIEKGPAHLPVSIGLGLSYLLQDRYRFLGDCVIENWGNIQPFSLDPVILRNAYRASIGFELVPQKGADTYWKRTYYRLGIAYNSTYYDVRGTGINELLFSGGLGLPMGPGSWLNLGIQVGLRGTTDNQLQKDTIIRLSAAISASEIWFLKFDEE